MPDPEISSELAARRIGVTRQAITTKRMDAILRPRRVRVGRRVVRYYRLSSLDAYRAMRDAQAAAAREIELEDYLPLGDDE